MSKMECFHSFAGFQYIAVWSWPEICFSSWCIRPSWIWPCWEPKGILTTSTCQTFSSNFFNHINHLLLSMSWFHVILLNSADCFFLVIPVKCRSRRRNNVPFGGRLGNLQLYVLYLTLNLCVNSHFTDFSIQICRMV